jgi:hypothetical protein
METNSFPIHRGDDLSPSQLDDNNMNLSFLPLSALSNCNEIIVSLLRGKDILEEIEKSVNGVAEKSPFLSPLVWVALVYVSDWEQEKKIIRNMLLSKIDCNYVGLCGFNLFHVYLVQSLLADTGFQKLKWWADKPMVDCNIFSLSLHNRPHIVMLHPSQLVSKIVGQSHSLKGRADRVLSYLVSRGMSCHYLDNDWKPLPDDVSMKERFLKQKTHTTRNKKNSNHQYLPTPQMNPLGDIPSDQHLLFTSSTRLTFRFHASFMESIIKTHRFPFTMETVTRKMLEKWDRVFEDQWVPREEFLIGSAPFLCHDEYMDADKMFIHLLNRWVAPIYPYSRIIMISSFPLTDRMYEYMCMRLRSSMFHLHPFHKKCETTWKDFFFWACYDCVNEFLFANQIEELVSQLEIFYSWTTPFLEEFPDVETFILMNSFQSTTYTVFSEEFDYTMFQVYHLFKKMLLFMKKV